MKDLPESRFFTRLGALSQLDKTLRELGVEPEPILEAHGLSCAMLAEGDRLVSLEQAAGLLEHAARETNSNHFSIELAARQDVNLLGAIGLLLQTADTVREALQDIEQYLRTTHVSDIHWTLVRRGEFDAFEVSAELPTISSHQMRMVMELSLAQCYRIVQSVSGGRLKIAKVCFRHGDDQSDTALRRFFHAPVQTAAEFNGLQFEAGAIDVPITRADTQLHESVRRLLLTQKIPLSVDSLAEQVKVLIRPLLPTGQCTLERIARCFSWDKRTLQRYLREDSDTSYQELLDDVRFDTACYYLKESNIQISQIAYLSGFSEQTNFSRAFRRRTGHSPRQWRQAHGHKESQRRLSPGSS